MNTYTQNRLYIQSGGLSPLLLLEFSRDNRIPILVSECNDIDLLEISFIGNISDTEKRKIIQDAFNYIEQNK